MMAYVEVDVDLDQFDDDEILSEFEHRLKKKNRGGSIQKCFHECDVELEDIFDLLLKIPKINKKNAPFQSIADEMKMEYIQEVFNDFSEFQFREMVNDYQQKQKGGFQ
jgi:hypothetical protein